MKSQDQERELARIKALREKHSKLTGDAPPHNHTIREIIDAAYLIESVQTDLTESIEEGHTHDGSDSAKVDWGDIDSRPSVFPPDTHSHPTSEVTSLQEYIEDTVGGMVSGNTETGIVVTYDDSGGKLNFAVPPLSADMTAGEALSGFHVVYGNTSTGKVNKAQSDGTIAEANAIGIVTESGGISNDATGEITFVGAVTNGSWTWTPQGDVYVSATAGGLTQTAPSTGYVKCVGTAITATTVFFNFQQPGWDAVPVYPELLTGFENRTDSTITLSTRTVTVAPAVTSFDIYSNGTKFVKTGGASCEATIDDTVGLHYIYFDNTGTLQHSMDAWDITSDNIPTAMVYWNGSAGVLYDERHSAYRDAHWHQWAHNTIGTRYISGLAGTFDSSSVSVTAGYIADEDIVFSITPTQTSVLVWYRDGSNMTFDATPSSVAAKVVAGALKYDNAGSLASISSAKYVTNWLYATNETTTPLMLVTGQAEYNTLALARTAPLPTFPNMPTAELKVIYRIIWQNSGGTPTYVEATDYRSSSTLPAGGTPSVSAAGVTFLPSGNIAATNVQTALEELDTEKQAISEKNANSGYAGLNSSGYVAHGQLGSGGGGSTKFLREDNSWQTVAGGASTAADVTFTPYGNIEAEDVQAAIEELDDEKAAASHSHATGDITDFSEDVADVVGAMVTSNTETGITVTYDDADNTLDFVVSDEYICDTAGAMFTSNTETGITVTYQDADNTVDLVVTPFDVVGGRLDYVSTTSLKWSFYTSNQIKLFNPTTEAWELVQVSSEPTLANTANDLNGTALAVDKVYDVFAEYSSATAFNLVASRWAVSTAGSSARNAAYNSGTAYAIGDRVTSGGKDYTCIQAGTNKTPASEPTYWVDNGTSVTGDFAGLYRHEGILVSDSSTTGKKRRWLGVIYTYNNSSTVNFIKGETFCGISNFYNKKVFTIKLWVDGGGSTYTSTSWTTYSNWTTTGLRSVFCISDSAIFFVQGAQSNATGDSLCGLSINGAAPVKTAGVAAGHGTDITSDANCVGNSLVGLNYYLIQRLTTTGTTSQFGSIIIGLIEC